MVDVDTMYKKLGEYVKAKRVEDPNFVGLVVHGGYGRREEPGPRSNLNIAVITEHSAPSSYERDLSKNLSEYLDGIPVHPFSLSEIRMDKLQEDCMVNFKPLDPAKYQFERFHPDRIQLVVYSEDARRRVWDEIYKAREKHILGTSITAEQGSIIDKLCGALKGIKSRFTGL